MSGKRLYSFRSGDRSEYLANYLFSCFSFSVPLLRQEDFGVADFMCVLGRHKDICVYPENAFYVQVKSDEKDIVFDKDQSNWISNHMYLPLLIGVIDKEKINLKLYTTSKAWVGLFMIYNPNKLTLKLNKGTDSRIVSVDQPNRELIVEIGNPILSLNIDEIEKNPELCLQVLQPWIKIDELNIARRSVGRVFCSSFINWKTNEIPSEGFNQYTFGPEFPKAENDIANILTALAHGYRINKQRERLDSIVKYMSNFEAYLDGEGKKFLSGEYYIVD